MADSGATQHAPCGGCGAPLEYEASLDAEMVICSYCNMANAVVPEGLKGVAEVAPLADLPTRFALGMRGSVRGRRFVLAGRTRYQYEDGYWDEWTLFYEDAQEAGWLTEDEGEWVLFSEKRFLDERVDVATLKARGTYPVEDRQVFVHERGTCSPIGAEGQAFMIPAFGMQYPYADGVAAGEEVILLDLGDRTALAIGEPLGPLEIDLDPA